ncbi:hypothetical protein GCM10020000_14970 [Streptomyces olivoverticillatus]
MATSGWRERSSVRQNSAKAAAERTVSAATMPQFAAASLPSLVERDEQRSDRDDEEADTGPVHPLRVRDLRLRRQGGDERGGDGRHARHGPEHRLEAVLVGEEAARERVDAGDAAVDGGDHTQQGAVPLGLGHLDPQHDQTQRDGRPGRALDDTADEQHRHALREGRDDTADDHQGQHADQHLAAPDHIAEPGQEEREQGRGGEEGGLGEPDLGGAGTEAVLDVLERRAEHARVQLEGDAGGEQRGDQDTHPDGASRRGEPVIGGAVGAGGTGGA